MAHQRKNLNFSGRNDLQKCRSQTQIGTSEGTHALNLVKLVSSKGPVLTPSFRINFGLLSSKDRSGPKTWSTWSSHPRQRTDKIWSTCVFGPLGGRTLPFALLQGTQSKGNQKQGKGPWNVTWVHYLKNRKKNPARHVQANVVQEAVLELSTVHNFWTVTHTSRCHKSAYLDEPCPDLPEMPSRKFLRSCTDCQIGTCTKHSVSLFRSCRLSGFGVWFVFVPIFSVFLYVRRVCLCSLILHWARNTSAREKVEGIGTRNSFHRPAFVGPEIV